MIKCVIFDLDGTLLNTLGTITYYVNVALEKNGTMPLTEDEVRSIIGHGARRLIEDSLSLRGRRLSEAEISAVLKDYLAAYDTDPFYLTEPYEGIRELLAELSRRGVTVAVLSNKQDSSTALAVRHFFGGQVAIARGGRDGVPLKPSPVPTLEVMREAGFSPSECAYVGDTEVDLLTGKNAAVAKNIAVSWGYRTEAALRAAGAEILAHKPMEIIDLI